MVTENVSSMVNREQDNCEAPCILGCPIRQDGRDYIQLIARRKFDEALEVVRGRNVLPSACGRICTHPCEDKCRRTKIDKSLAISWLKRFLCDRAGGRDGGASVEKTEIRYTEKIAIVGGGPAGLAAAHDLAALGYQCTVFEASGEAGGMIGIGVPVFRLPRADIANDVAFVTGLGVEFRCNTKVGEDVTIDDIRNEGFSAIFLTVGLPLSKSLPIKGIDTEGVLKGVNFLHEANSTGKAAVGDKALIIGGGAVAMDCARTAMRLGPKEVHISCLESRDTMPTSEYEIEETLHEGIILHASRGPKRVVVEDGKVKGLEVLDVQSVFDDQGRFNPSFHEGSEKVIEADTIIIAIGQGSDLSVINGIEGIETTRGGTIVVDKDTLMTGVQGIFAGGDIVLGRGTMTLALEHGKKAAFTIHNYLQGKDERDRKFDEIEPIPELAQRRIDLIKREERAAMPVIDDSRRVTGFDEVELGFSEESAVKEAQRCMNCGAGAKVIADKCIGCLTCVRACPYEIPVINNGKAPFINGDCQSCGICVVECPANAIEFSGQYEDQGEQELADAITGMNGTALPKIINIFCHYSKLAAPDAGCSSVTSALRSSSGHESEILDVGVLGLSKIDQTLLLHAFEMGADGVLVTVCKDDDCHFGSSCAQWTGRKIDTAISLLGEVGIARERVMVIPCNSNGNDLADAVKDMTAALRLV